jgi:hypothetical protein
MCLAALAFNTAQAVGRAKGSLAVVFGGETREEYLRRLDPSYAAAHFATTSLPADAVILSQDYRLFYFPCRVTRENVYRRETNYPAQPTRRRNCALMPTGNGNRTVRRESCARSRRVCAKTKSWHWHRTSRA